MHNLPPFYLKRKIKDEHHQGFLFKTSNLRMLQKSMPHGLAKIP